VELSPIEAAAARLARDRLDRDGARPSLSGALVLAARELARRAATGAPAPLDRASLRYALARALSYDPAPTAYLVQHQEDRIVEALAHMLGRGTATHVGVGAAEAGGSVVLVLLASSRKARLDPFPREVPLRGRAIVSGRLARGLVQPRVFLTIPAGTVREAKVGGGAAFTAELSFPEAGRYLVELVAQGAGGPEVAALFPVSAGGAAEGPPPALQARVEPPDAGAAEGLVLDALNTLRSRHGLQPVRASPKLADVARRHSEAMLAEGRVAHVVTGSGPLGGRLLRAGIAYRQACENVARAATSLGAHEAAEESPAHRANMLRSDVTRAGVGIARGSGAAGEPTAYLTEILVEPSEDQSESRLTPDARVREALWRDRARLALPPLTSDATLDALARDAAHVLRETDAGERGELEQRALALGRRWAAVDVFVASATGDAVRSANLRDPRFRRVGVGVVEGASRRFGASRLFIAIVYTD
jgi:uncharacterized protein YkwD